MKKTLCLAALGLALLLTACGQTTDQIDEAAPQAQTRNVVTAKMVDKDADTWTLAVQADAHSTNGAGREVNRKKASPRTSTNDQNSANSQNSNNDNNLVPTMLGHSMHMHFLQSDQARREVNRYPSWFVLNPVDGSDRQPPACTSDKYDLG